MPAGLPGDSAVNNAANPNAGRPVIFDPLSGPKGSPLDKDPVGKQSTGALSTGIGFGLNSIFFTNPGGVAEAPQLTVQKAGFNYNQEPGTKPTYAAPPPAGVVTTNFTDGRYMYIGGGRSSANAVTPDKYSVPFAPNPYVTGIALLAAGNGGSRDAGAGPAFTGFGMRLLAAAAGVANGAVVVAGFTNRAGVALITGQSVFTSEVAAQAAPA